VIKILLAESTPHPKFGCPERDTIAVDEASRIFITDRREK